MIDITIFHPPADAAARVALPNVDVTLFDRRPI
jgi:hypothetical protein